MRRNVREPHAVVILTMGAMFLRAKHFFVLSKMGPGILQHPTKAQEETLALKSMPIGKLVEMRNRIDAILASKVADQRRTLQSELTKLTRFQPNGSRIKIGARRGGVVAPKYRNPDNPSEAWAGRGLKPRWMTAAMKRGKKLEDFLIAKARKASK